MAEISEVPNLSNLEKDLQNVIDSVSRLSISGVSEQKQHACKQFEKELRQKMRLLRRWRNGTAICHCADSQELDKFISKSRRLTLDIRMAVLQDKVKNVEHTIDHDDTDSVLTTLGYNIGHKYATMQESLWNLTSDTVSKSEFDRLVYDIAEMENDIRILEDRLKVKRGGLRGIFSKRKIRMPSKRISSHKVHRIEDHPLANKVLRNAGRVRRMMEAFKSGGHVDMNNGTNTADQCMTNDMEVLRRQLRKIQQWQQCLQPFSTSEIDDLELIVSAIERHIRPDVDLEAPITRRDRVIYLSTSSEDTTSRTSETSDETPINPPPQKQETQHSNDDCHMTVDIKSYEQNNNCLDGSCPEDSIIDERLI